MKTAEEIVKIIEAERDAATKSANFYWNRMQEATSERDAIEFRRIAFDITEQEFALEKILKAIQEN